MGESEVKQEMDELGDLIVSLEEQAGITGAVKQARENGSPAKLRDAYYSVADIELRKKLITTTGRLDQLYLQKCDQDVSLAKDEVSRAIDKTNQQPWHIAAASWLAPVGIGHWALGLVGAVGGAIAGYFLSQWVINVIKKDDSKVLEQAKHSLVLALKRNEHSKIDPYLFSVAEQAGCEREK
jgi:predicted RND superfamily exporter protein